MRYQLSAPSYNWRNWDSKRLSPITIRAELGFKPRQCESMAGIVLHSEQAEYFYLQVDRNEGSKEVSRETGSWNIAWLKQSRARDYRKRHLTKTAEKAKQCWQQRKVPQQTGVAVLLISLWTVPPAWNLVLWESRSLGHVYILKATCNLYTDE